MLFHLDTLIPTAFIFNLPDFEFGFPAFSHCLFNLLRLTRTRQKLAVLPAQIECCERERRLTDSFAGVLPFGDDSQAIPLSF